MKKTNAARILENLKISFELKEYQVVEDDLSAEHVAVTIGADIGIVYKTLILRGDKTGVIVAIVPGASEVDLKALASVSQNKKCEMVPLKDVQNLTGYIRGGCSPIGMKKQFPTFMDEIALQHPKIYVSAGMRGLQLFLSPLDLVRATSAKIDNISIFTSSTFLKS